MNRIIAAMTQKQLLKSASILAVLYIGFNFLREMFFFPSMLILWVVGYFIIAYIKFYCKNSYASVKVNISLLLGGITGAVGLVLVTDLLGAKISAVSVNLLGWASNYNPFLILIAFAAFGLARSVHFKSRVVNRISKCSLLIYIIHENILLRSYLRPYIWHCIFAQYGYAHVLLWVFAFAAVWFALALVLSIVYEESIQKITKRMSEVLLKWIGAVYQKYETVMLKIS